MDVRDQGTTRRLGEVLMPPQDLDQMIDVLAAMPGVHLDAKPRRVERHGGKFDGIDVNAFRANGKCKLFGLCFVS
jgi:hypothetical protein